MNEFIQALQAKSDQINAADLVGSEMTITISGIKINLTADQKVSMSFSESADKVYRPCKGMGRLMALIWGSDPQEFIGRKLTLYCDSDVKFGSEAVGGLRIKAMSHMDRAQIVPVKVSRTSFKKYTIEPIRATGAPQKSGDVLDAARKAAQSGTEAFKTWWRDNPGARGAANKIIEDLRQICLIADNAAAEAADPFHNPTPDDIAAAMAEAEAAAKQQEQAQ